MDPSQLSSSASREHLKALDTLGRARTFFIALALFAVASHAAVWAAVYFFDVLHAPAASAPAEAAAADVDLRASAMAPLMTFAEFLGRCAILLLCITMLMAVLVSVSGRLAGISDLIVGFYLSIIVGALFVPWDRLTPREAGVAGVFTTLEKIRQHDAVIRGIPLDAHKTFFSKDVGIKRHDYDIALDAARFAGLPLVAAILLLGVGRRFTRAHRVAARTTAHEIPMKVV